MFSSPSIFLVSDALRMRLRGELRVVYKRACRDSGELHALTALVDALATRRGQSHFELPDLLTEAVPALKEPLSYRHAVRVLFGLRVPAGEEGTPPKDWYDIGSTARQKEAARLLGKSERTVRDMLPTMYSQLANELMKTARSAGVTFETVASVSGDAYYPDLVAKLSKLTPERRDELLAAATELATTRAYVATNRNESHLHTLCGMS